MKNNPVEIKAARNMILPTTNILYHELLVLTCW